jgi:hypothetical protein
MTIKLFTRSLHLTIGKAIIPVNPSFKPAYGFRNSWLMFGTCPIIGWTFFRILWFRFTLTSPQK